MHRRLLRGCQDDLGLSQSSGSCHTPGHAHGCMVPGMLAASTGLSKSEVKPELKHVSSQGGLEGVEHREGLSVPSRRQGRRAPAAGMLLRRPDSVQNSGQNTPKHPGETVWSPGYGGTSGAPPPGQLRGRWGSPGGTQEPSSQRRGGRARGPLDWSGNVLPVTMSLAIRHCRLLYTLTL